MGVNHGASLLSEKGIIQNFWEKILENVHLENQGDV
jgi:hypothetical protein